MAEEGHSEPVAESEGIGTWKRLVILGFLSGLGAGYNNNVMAPTLKRLHDIDSFSTELDGVLSASLWLGAAFGSFVGGILAEMLGRRRTAMLGESAILIFGVSQIIVFYVPWICLARIGLGFGVGFCTLAKPLYIAELSPPSQRGTMISTNSFFYGASFWVVYFMNLITLPLSDAAGWRIILVVGALPALCLLLFIAYYIEESPLWLAQQAMKGNAFEDEAISDHAAERLPLAQPSDRGFNCLSVRQPFVPPFSDGVDEPASDEAQTVGDKEPSGLDLVRLLLMDPEGRIALKQAIVLLLAEQLTGVTGLLLYTEDSIIFTGVSNPNVWLLVTATFSVIGAAGGLASADRIGRKTQMLAGIGGMFVGTVIIVGPKMFSSAEWACYASACGFQLAICAFSAGVVPAFFTAVTEVWPNRYRSTGMGIILGLLYATSMLMQVLFAVGGKQVMAFFIVSAVMQLALFAGVWAIVPETGGKDFTE